MKRTNGSDGYGIILKQLRLKANLNLKECAIKINKSAGWICEVENGRGLSRVNEFEFERIIEALDGSKYRKMFMTWVAVSKNKQNTDRTLDGAVMKHIRLKKRLRLKEASLAVGVSVSRLSQIERGIIPMSFELKNKLMVGYGYTPSSFKNFSKDPLRAKAVPTKFKLEILIKSFTDHQVEELFMAAEKITQSATKVSQE